MKKVFFILAAACAGLLSCSTPKVAVSTAPFIRVDGKVRATTTLTDLEVREDKVNGVWSKDSDSKTIVTRQTAEELAVGNALEESQADLIVAPIFTYLLEKGELIKVSVSGYPGYYKNFRTFIPEKDTCKVVPTGEPSIVIYNNKK